MIREDWPAYVARITRGLSREKIAQAAGIHHSGIGRWLRDQNRPSAEKVVGFARGIGQPPVEALVAAGYLEPDEADKVIEVHQSLSELSNEELLAELGRRLTEPAKSDDVGLRLARPDEDTCEGV